ncbi:hypothetical protein M406DRAFT_70253 [Cryphonectria parasitica EP155]|uniref:2,6-dihydroxypyridine 3-monooxygenase substrate binding domain-containing protein n=1 Tax=Cryphonectria parasitica (strain ATCC 38755 / EP155) TaxID=660469 RepID=A0A9P4Y808_CRYP1|nr:uncharacterized protein M406DRAFT_70253 [Cryphonectria parasitica EP155]KAF3768160.1 hypothetical protein M406DRAFT_70253 [Cryphonectria parasitica EP155]
MSADKSGRTRDLTVVIVGGSLAGLLCGVTLKHAGFIVRILEQHGSERKSQATGLGLGPNAQAFLEDHDCHGPRLSHTVTSLLILGHDNTIRRLAAGRRDLTSWDAVFYRLRWLFNGYISQYFAEAGEAFEAGCSTYETCKQVLEVRRPEDTDSPITLTVLDTNSHELEHVQADFVIGADGPNSLIRALYLPDVQREYAGYVMWRGLVPEDKVSSATLDLFERSVIAHKTSRNSSCVMYMIPGVNGSLQRGERLLNFIWYTNESTDDMDEIMTDGIDGHSHRNFVPPGRVRSDIWASHVREAERLPLPGPFLEVATKIEQPSLQIVTDYCSPHAAFENGRILLIGDALSQFRPHAALGVSQAAYHVAAVREYLEGTITWQQWETRVVRRSYLHWSLNVWWGDFYQKSFAAALPACFRYWTYNFLYNLRSWWSGGS